MTVPIGLPRALEPAPAALRVDLSDLASLPPRDPAGTKYDAGAVLVVGGAPGTSGAPLLAASAAMRAGAGVVFAAVAPEAQAQVSIGMAELMVHGTRDPDEVLALAARAQAVVLGPGLGRDDDARRLVDALVEGVEGALLLDADALQALAGRLGDLRGRRGPTALTPHAGELARLLGVERAAVTAERLAHVERRPARRLCRAAEGPGHARRRARRAAAAGRDGRPRPGHGRGRGRALGCCRDAAGSRPAARRGACARRGRTRCRGRAGRGVARDVLRVRPGAAARSAARPMTRLWLDVDADAIRANAALLARTLGSSELWAVVKADGYGHGATLAARAALAGGATRIGVATLDEGRSLRAALGREVADPRARPARAGP